MTEKGTSVPLTEAQSGLWYAQRLDPANPIFNTGQYLDLKGPLHVEALTAAVAQAGEEADALALRFADGPDGPRQYVDPSRRPRLTLIDFSGESDAEARALAAIHQDIATPIAPEEGQLARQTLYRLSDTHHLWAQQVHHFAIDGYGMVLLTSRIAELYGLFMAGQTGGGRPFGSLRGVWDEDAAYRLSTAREDDAHWWRHAMTGAPDVVGMAPGKPVSAFHFHRFEQPLPTATREQLLRRAKQAGVGWPDAITAIVGAYIRRLTGGEEVTIGVPHMGRMGTASARVPAMVMNVLPLRVVPDEERPLDQFLADVALTTVEARRHGRYRSEQLRRDLGLIGGHRRLYGPLVNVQPYDRPPRMAGLDVQLHVTGTGPVEDINFTFRGDAVHHLSIEVDANPSLYSEEEVASHGIRLAEFLSNAIHSETLSDVPTATAAEAEAELFHHNSTAHPVVDTTLAALIEQRMRAQPDAEALRFGKDSLTYRQLDNASAALATELRKSGVGPDVLVAVDLPRSFELVIALVAILRAGGAYLPLDRDHPPARIATILDSASPVRVIAWDDPHGLYGEHLMPPACRDAGISDLRDALPGEAFPSGAIKGDDAAYVIYTSGSTGQPKGVVVTHRAIVNRLLWMADHYGISDADHILQKTPATFDVSVWEFFLPLLTGATLIIAPPGAHRDPAALAALIRQDEVTILHFVPSMLRLFLDSPDSDGLTLRCVFCSGEELPADLRNQFHHRLHAELHNLYGPTEAAVDVSYWPASPADRSRPVPIGWPVWNTRLLILDEYRRPVPPGVTGHLHLGGVQLARGYLGQPDLTAERFFDSPWHPGERLYLTGDLARRRPDGAVVFLGRSDHQVKIRGLRIELGEIEAAISDTGQVRSGHVIAQDERLVAYIVPDTTYDTVQFREALLRRLPDYMVPAAIVPLDTIPVTTNGKLDRTALPRPQFDGGEGDRPETSSEQRLALLFQEVLDLPGPIGTQDDFFTLGGDSLLAVRLILRVREEWGYDPGLPALFEYSSLSAFAARIDEAAKAPPADGLGPIMTLARGGNMPPLFLIHPAGGLCWGYRGLAQALSPARTVYGLQSPVVGSAQSEPENLTALAQDYARRIVEAETEGPYHIAGWSVGGIIAQAVAVALQSMGKDMGLVAMLDSYPAECWRAEPEPTPAQALRALLAMAGLDPDAHTEVQTREEIVALLQKSQSPLAQLPGETLQGVIRAVSGTNRLIRGHYETRYDGVLTHIRAGRDHQDKPGLRADLWANYAETLDCVTVPFLHSQMTGPQASACIAPLLTERMAAAERDG